MRARRRRYQIDRPSAIRTIDVLDVLAKLLELRPRQRPDKILFLQEIEEADEPTVIVDASPIGEPGVSLKIMCEPQLAAASRAFHGVGKRLLRRRLLLADQLQQFQR